MRIANPAFLGQMPFVPGTTSPTTEAVRELPSAGTVSRIRRMPVVPVSPRPICPVDQVWNAALGRCVPKETPAPAPPYTIPPIFDVSPAFEPIGPLLRTPEETQEILRKKYAPCPTGMYRPTPESDCIERPREPVATGYRPRFSLPALPGIFAGAGGIQAPTLGRALPVMNIMELA